MQNLDYYEEARKASSVINNHQGLLYIQNKAKHSKNILDVGCGEGTRLTTLLPKDKNGTGVDIAKKAIDMAKKRYPNHNFIQTQAETLPFKDSSFDLVYTTYVFEHTNNQTKFITEMLRVLDPQGELIIICPNYGAPNRRSPNSVENPLKKILEGIYGDFIPSSPTNLKLTKVVPKKSYHQIDDDTTVEPYILKILRYLRQKGLKIKKASSLWELEEKTKNPRKLLFLLLGRWGIFPFRYWGPQIFLVIAKK